ncbi:MAG: MFS transporter [Azonexus sp.]|jgi:PPP family 3-phenylpropionic acid transporter|uniref:MFS transporter n=1 Tax=Azonexus sp. TaxID=1872668 RepID=UPI002817DE25|nr:MFS transporter [Azonexus sp.]MDR0777612.1 MFS transporter [Azonexus sp.]
MHVLPYWRLSGYYFFYFAFIGAFSPYFGLYLQSLNFSAWDIGLLMSQMQLMRMFGPNLWGWLADRYGHRTGIIRLAGVIALAGFSAFFWLDRLPGMLLAMALLAFFWSAALPLVEMLTFDHLREERNRYSRIRLWGSVGFIVTVMGAGALLDRVAPSGVLWVCWGILLGILACALVLPETPASPPQREAPPIMAILRQPRVAALMAACFAMSAAHGAFYVFYSIHLAANGYSRTAVGLLWSLGVLAEIGVFLAMGRLARRYSLRAILLACFAAAVLRFLLMGWGVASVGAMVFVQLLHGLTFGAYHASAISAVHAWFPGRAQGRGQALYSSLSFGAGGLLGALISGQTWDDWGAGWTFTLAALFGLLGFLLVWGWVREPADARPADGKDADPVR